MSDQIILASSSQTRRQLLRSAGIEAGLVSPLLDEEAFKRAMRAQKVPVRDQAIRLAELKALKISSTQNGLVIGCDQMLSLGEEAFDKPKDMAEATAQLKKLSGKTHILETAIVIAEGGHLVWRHLARPKLTMRMFSDRFLGDYIEKMGGSLCSTVGGYQLEGIGSQLFEKIEGDYFSILGLPLLPLMDYLRQRQALLS